MKQPDGLAAGRVAAWRLLVGVVLLLAAPTARADTVAVTVDGIDAPLLGNVRKLMSINQKHEEPWRAARIRRLHRLARSQIQQALAPYGYYHPRISAKLNPPAGEGDTEWQAVYEIVPGPPTIVTALHLDVVGPGSGFPAFEQILVASELRVGDRLLHGDYKQTKAALAAAAYHAGYLDARFVESALRVNPATNTAAINLVLDTGERYYFGDIDIRQDFLASDFVHEFVPFKPGEPFDAERLIDLQLALSETGYFSQVLIKPKRDAVYRAGPRPPSDPSAPPGQLRVPIQVDAPPSKPQRYRISAGYGTDTGPRIGFGVQFRHLNAYGHQLRFDLRLSAVERTLHTSYDIPIENVAQDRLSFVGTLSNEQFGDITSNRAGAGVVRDTGWELGRKRAYLHLWHERYDLRDGGGDRNSALLAPGYTVTVRQIDDVLKTRSGYAFTFDVHGASDALGSSTNFLQAQASAEFILPLTQRSRLLLGSALGATKVTDFNLLPPSQRFFAGGSNSVRGYLFQEISPTNGDEIDVGGKYLAVASIEADYRVYQDYYLAAFYDLGDASNIPRFDFKRGVGFGFRWASPIGMIRLDLAHPLDDPNDSFRIHFSIGPAF